MRKKIYYIAAIAVLTIGTTVFYIQYKSQQEKAAIAELRIKHKQFLENSPFKKTLSLSKEERKAQGIPPNKYYERQWELTMNPTLGHPEPHKTLQLQKQLKQQRSVLTPQAPGQDVGNPWIERGPNNVGGRTRVVFFDPNDGTNSRVFAGGVSGGLWVTEDITTDGGWTRVTNVPGNLNVSCYAIDPNDSNTWYIGTGEQYTFGAAVGNGVYRTTDGGVTWTNIPVQLAGGDSFNNFLAGIFYINDIITWNNVGTTELFIGVGAHLYGDADSPNNWLGVQSAGLYRSIDNGANWSRIESANMEFQDDGNTYYFIPNDLEISADNTLWMSTIETSGFGGANGEVFSSTDGAIWTEQYQVPNGDRVEIETSTTVANKLYVLAETNGNPTMYVTTDAFATDPTAITLPNDPDGSVPAGDFTRGQAFYDLVVEADPTNDNIVYVGGINVHRSDDSGITWSTISHWSTFWSTAGSPVHADQHALTFRPGNSNQAVLGHDGGISFATDLLAGVGTNNSNVIYDVDLDYNTVQFYHMGVAPIAFAANSFLAGAQDNGTPYFEDGDPSAPDSSIDISGGDGAYSFYDQVNTDYLIVNFVYNNSIDLYDFSEDDWRTIAQNNNNEGDFINPQALDSNLDLLYSNGGSNRLFRYGPDLSNLSPAGQATRAILTNALLDASITALEVSPYTTTQTNMIIGLENGKLLKLTNANTVPTWEDITEPSFVGSISDVQFGQSENHIFVTFYNYGVSSVWYTSNGGNTWQNKEGDLPDLPVRAILQNPLLLNEVIVGTDLGVWRTDDFNSANPSWTQSYNGMSDVVVTDLQLRDDNMVFAATFGRGVFSGQFTNPNDTDGDGVVNVNDMCPGTLIGVTVDADGCEIFTLPEDNFVITVTSESCSVNNDGSIEISATDQTLSYQANLTGPLTDANESFMTSAQFSDLSAGDYVLTITVDGETYQKQYDITITEPENLLVQSQVNATDNVLNLQLEGGTIYNIELNGVITQTNENQITLSLKDGTNTLKVTTDKDCQGIYEKTLLIDGSVVSPNPFSTELTVTMNTDLQTTINIYNVDGRQVYTRTYPKIDSQIGINTSSFPSGIYFLKINNKTHKIIKQ